MIDSSSTVRRNANVVVRELAEGEGAVLLHLDSGQYHGVNQIGQAVWELLDGERSMGDVVAELRARVEDPPDSIEADVLKFVDEVEQRDLVTVA